ncbi:MAG: GDSL-type esterase/lipase family protein [Shewanella sp.]
MNIRFIIFVLCVFISACGPKLKPLSASAEIMAFGDSLTYGKGASEGADYPAVLAELTGLRVINAGISGETTLQGLSRLAELLARETPDLLILLEGGNDFLRHHDIAKTKTNLAQMIELADAQSIPVVLIAVPQKGVFLSPATLYSELAERYDVILLEEVLTDLLKTRSMKSDMVHLNDAGYQALAETIYQRLKNAGAI